MRRIARRPAWLVATLAVALVLVPVAAARAETFTVTNTDNDGAGSLRQAILDANGTSGPDLIDSTGVSGAIVLASELPDLSDDVEIRGPGASELTVLRCNVGLCPIFRIFTIGFNEVTIDGLTVSNGLVTSGSGGGIINFGGTLTVLNSTVSDNTVSGGGSGGGISNDGTLTVLNSTVSGNDAEVGGGGIGNSGALTVGNSTVSGNEAGVGGGVYNAGDLTVENSTVSGNVAPAGVNVFPGPAFATTTLSSTILSNPGGGGGNCTDGAGSLLSEGYNLADDASCSLDQATDLVGVDPGLGPLAANGGPTGTMALPLGSPAVDKGISDGLTTDQRGLPRPSDFPAIPNALGGDRSDIGAFELQVPVPPSNEFSFGKLKRNKKRGTAKLSVIVPGPGELELAKTKKVKGEDKRAAAAGEVKLAIKPRPKSTTKLKAKGKAKVKANITFVPDGGTANTKTKKLKLVMR